MDLSVRRQSAEYQELTLETGDAFLAEVQCADHASADQRLDPVMRDLRAGFQHPDDRAEVDEQPGGGFARPGDRPGSAVGAAAPNDDQEPSHTPSRLGAQ